MSVSRPRFCSECGYLVVATTRAEELRCVIKNKDEKIDLLLAEFRLIEMNKYQLLDNIRSISEIPVVVVGANVGNDVISDCLCRGAEFYLKKPLTESDLKYLSQFIIRMKGKKEDLDEYKGESLELGDQKKPELTCPEMQNEFRETDDQLSQGKKRKGRMDTHTGEHTEKDLGDQKMPKLVFAEEANNERKEPTEIKKNEEKSVEIKEKLELACVQAELAKWSTEPVSSFASYVRYEFADHDFQPLESIGECMGHYEIPLSPRESSNKNTAAQTHRAVDEEEVMQDGLSLADLAFDLQEGQGSTSDLDKKDSDDFFSEIISDFAKELKP